MFASNTILKTGEKKLTLFYFNILSIPHLHTFWIPFRHLADLCDTVQRIKVFTHEWKVLLILDTPPLPLEFVLCTLLFPIPPGICTET